MSLFVTDTLNSCEGKIALVTGAANGIGRACMQALAQAGAQVLATDIEIDELARVVDKLAKTGAQIRILAQDVTDEKQWAEMVASLKENEGGLNVLVNNAGIAVAAPLIEMSLDDFRRQNAVNVDGVFMGCKHAIPLMAETGGGSIINISSVAGLIGASGLAGYSASKGAVRLFSKAVAMECADAQLPIRCNSVHPGIIDTDIWGKEISGLGASNPDLMSDGGNRINIELMTAEMPGGRPGSAEEIANAVVFLASDAASYINGTELVVDYGMTAR